MVSNIISLGFKMSSRVVVERVPGRGQILRYRTLAMRCWFGCSILGQYYGDRYWVDPIGSLFETFYICGVRFAGNAIGGESAPLIIMIRLTKCTGGCNSRFISK